MQPIENALCQSTQSSPSSTTCLLSIEWANRQKPVIGWLAICDLFFTEFGGKTASRRNPVKLGRRDVCDSEKFTYRLWFMATCNGYFWRSKVKLFFQAVCSQKQLRKPLALNKYFPQQMKQKRVDGRRKQFKHIVTTLNDTTSSI